MSVLIESDPEILGGKPVVRGTRIPVDLILELVEAGYSPEEIAEEYPELKPEIIIQLIKLAKMIHESIGYDRVKSLVG
ncbi:MAG: hypothetical protein B9J98_07725 [Candidatus Terraquivivens tikiterensis]|uniref:Antitoxin n=1 Tax=Candidatus Terraquivivens tikiterensis TaxID=1980982 RepID=A0A2R7Y0V6_9ARCH|nr:MAG: hypothetical protein B9J98_07725 [Candidatus Terraquivivens tikiterensis]